MAEMMPEPAMSAAFAFSFDDTLMPDLAVKDLAEYLYYLRVTYGLALDVFTGENPDQLAADPDYVRATLVAFISGHEVDTLIESIHQSDLGQSELIITKLRKESPLEMVVTGSVIALVAAAIVSGGEVDLKLAKFKLRPLGDGLLKLKRLFKKA